MMKKALVILSGGLDSTILLYEAHSKDFDLHAISFNYGQRHSKELECAKITCTKLGVPLKVIDISPIVDIFAGSCLTEQSISVPDGHYQEESMKSTVVPNRNSIFINLAMAYAISNGIQTIYYGAHAGDHAIYPDCRPEFVFAIHNLGLVVDYNPLYIYAPYLRDGKEDIVKIGAELNVPFEDTWSCYKGGKIHCGTCGTCTERKEAFKLAGIEDPTEYEK